MPHISRAAQLLLGSGVFIALAFLSLQKAEADAFYPPDTMGYDISFPQCGTEFPTDGQFAIIGVNDGRPWTFNPCFLEQYQWAKSKQSPAAVYVNTANPGPRASQWNQSGPQTCADPSSYDDAGCAYNYGWNAVHETFTVADQATGGELRGHYWWLDVETMNRWDGTPQANAAIIAAYMDYLSPKVAGVGIYSTGYQWKTITGGQQYASAPNWVAGADGAHDAPGFCDRSFTGGPVWLVQYIANNLDNNFVCEAAGATGVPQSAVEVEQEGDEAERENEVDPEKERQDRRADLLAQPVENRLTLLDRIRSASGLTARSGDSADPAALPGLKEPKKGINPLAPSSSLGLPDEAAAR